jgi:hypothetical protein
MTGYELADYAASLMSNFLATITIYFSVLTAYVVTEFSMGARLARLQLSVINLSYIIARGIMGSLLLKTMTYKQSIKYIIYGCRIVLPLRYKTRVYVERSLYSQLHREVL